MARDEARQFPPIADLPRYSERRFIDPAILDRPVGLRAITDAPPARWRKRWGWALAYAAGCIGIFLFITYLGSI